MHADFVRFLARKRIIRGTKKGEKGSQSRNRLNLNMYKGRRVREICVNQRTRTALHLSAAFKGN